MAAITNIDIPHGIEWEFNLLLGQTCCRQHVGNDLSLFLGFGSIIYVTNPKGESPHGMYEIGTYRSDWRLIENQRILCGSNDVVDSIDDFREQIMKLDGATCAGIRMLTEFDVRIEFNRGLCVDFFATFGDEDEVIHVFLPDDKVVSFSNHGGWVSHAAK